MFHNKLRKNWPLGDNEIVIYLQSVSAHAVVSIDVVSQALEVHFHSSRIGVRRTETSSLEMRVECPRIPKSRGMLNS